MNSLRCIPLAIVLSFSALAQAQSNIGTLTLTFTTIDVPGAAVTNIEGINNTGMMVGDYSSASYNKPSHGFLYSGGIFTFFNYPGADSTLAFGINDSGLISGTAYTHQNTTAFGFLYNGVTFTTLRAPGKGATLPRGLNNAGVVVGGDGVNLQGTKGFMLVGKQFKTLAPPGVYTYVFGDSVNNLQQVVGTDDTGGFFFSGGKYKTIAVPGASETQAWGINDSGIIVGWYLGNGCVACGFALQNGKYTTINYPGAVYTFLTGINNAGQIVGVYSIDEQTYHGFVTSAFTSKDSR